jgi:hypothetical protein
VLGTGISYNVDRTLKISNGVAVYSGYSTGSNRPTTYDIALQVGLAGGIGFEIVADWIGTDDTPLYVRSLRDCCQNWSSFSRILTDDYARATIFYDSANTSYYVDPNSSSVLDGLKLIGTNNEAAGSGSDAILWVAKPNNNDWGIKVTGDLEYLLQLHGASSHSYNVRGLAAGSEFWRVGTDLLYHNSNIRAPIFYDSANTSFYLDPASTGTSLNVAGNALAAAYYNAGGALGTNASNARNHFTGINSGGASVTTGWIAAAFGDADGNRTVIGQASGYAYLGAHNANLTDWAPLNLQNDSASATVMIGFPWGTAPDNTYRLKVNGAFAATTKSFLIPHPTKEGYRLRYGSLEGPENGVYVRGRLTGNNVIELPDYWVNLVDENTITVQLTPIGKYQKTYVNTVSINKVIISCDEIEEADIDCYYLVLAERKDVEKLIVEVEG